MSRTFWMVVGAVGGVAVYRKGTRAAARARELGPVGSAQVAAAATGRIAERTASGLGRLQDVKARREGRLVTGSLDTSQVQAPPVGWLRVPEDPAAESGRSEARTPADAPRSRAVRAEVGTR